jgi:hypothetical protein
VGEQQRLAAVLDCASGRDPHEPDADREDRTLEGDQRSQRRVLRPLRGRGQADDHQSCSRERHADPLTPPQMKAKESLSDHSEEDEPSGQDRLHGRERGERERFDVQAPGEQSEDPSDRKPPRAKQIRGAAQRMADLDRSRESRCAASLEQRAHVGPQRTNQRKAQSQDHGKSRAV